MTLVKDIQTIAKTDEIEDKAGKALQEAQSANAAVKALILGERGIAGQETTPIGGSSDSAGISIVSNPPPSGDGSGSVNLNPPPSTTTPNNTTPSSGSQGSIPSTIINGSDLTTEKTANQITNNGNLINGLGGLSSTDLSGKAYQGGTGGSSIKNFAEGAPNDSIKTQLNSQMTAQGASTAQKNTFNNKYDQDKYAEPGTFTAKQLADNTTIGPALTLDLSSVNGETVKAVVGFEPTGKISTATGKPLVVKAQINETGFPTPSIADTAGKSNPWEAWNVPPDKVGWQYGYYWQVNGFYNGTTPGDAAQNFINIAIKPSFPNAYWDTLTQVSNTSWTFHYYHNPGDAPITTATNFRVPCAMVPDSFCTLTNPLEEFWPETGSIIVNYTDGQITTSIYDGEQTLTYTNGGSIVRMAIGNNIDIIDSRFMDIEPAIDGGFLLVIRDNSLQYSFSNFYRADGTLARAVISEQEYQYFKPQR